MRLKGAFVAASTLVLLASTTIAFPNPENRLKHRATESAVEKAVVVTPRAGQPEHGSEATPASRPIVRSDRRFKLNPLFGEGPRAIRDEESYRGTRSDSTGADNQLWQVVQKAAEPARPLFGGRQARVITNAESHRGTRSDRTRSENQAWQIVRKPETQRGTPSPEPSRPLFGGRQARVITDDESHRGTGAANQTWRAAQAENQRALSSGGGHFAGGWWYPDNGRTAVGGQTDHSSDLKKAGHSGVFSGPVRILARPSAVSPLPTPPSTGKSSESPPSAPSGPHSNSGLRPEAPPFTPSSLSKPASRLNPGASPFAPSSRGKKEA